MSTCNLLLESFGTMTNISFVSLPGGDTFAVIYTRSDRFWEIPRPGARFRWVPSQCAVGMYVPSRSRWFLQDVVV